MPVVTALCFLGPWHLLTCFQICPVLVVLFTVNFLWNSIFYFMHNTAGYWYFAVIRINGNRVVCCNVEHIAPFITITKKNPNQWRKNLGEQLAHIRLSSNHIETIRKAYTCGRGPCRPNQRHQCVYCSVRCRTVAYRMLSEVKKSFVCATITRIEAGGFRPRCVEL